MLSRKELLPRGSVLLRVRHHTPLSDFPLPLRGAPRRRESDKLFFRGRMVSVKKKTLDGLEGLHQQESNMTKKSALKATAPVATTAEELLNSVTVALNHYFSYPVTYTDKQGIVQTYNGLEYTQISVLNGMCYNLTKQVRYLDDQEDALRVEAKGLIEQAQNGIEIWEGNFTRVKEKLTRIQDCKHAAELALQVFVKRHDLLSDKPFTYNAPVNFKTAAPNKQNSTAASELANMLGVSFEPRRSNGTL